MTATTETGDLPAVTGATTEHESPLVPSPTPTQDWFVSLVPRPDAGSEDDDPGPADADSGTAEAGPDEAAPDEAAPDGVDLPAATSIALTPAQSVDPAPGPATARARLTAALRAGLTGPAGALLSAVVVAPGIALDLARDGSFGFASSVLFVLAAVATALAVRPRALVTAVALPPLVFVGAVATIAWRSGQNDGTRQMALDVGTTLAVQAPVLFGGTATALGVVLARAAVRLVRR